MIASSKCASAVLSSSKCARTVLASALLLLLVAGAVLGFAGVSVYADDLGDVSASSDSDSGVVGINQETGYRVVIEDTIDLLTDTQEEALYEDMYPITQYGNVAFMTYYGSDSDYEEAAGQYCNNTFGRYANAVVFVIDMTYRQLIIHSDGDVYDVITSGYATSITDNIYTYATDGDYYTCASMAYSQIYTVLEGGFIARPMKYICNFLIAVGVGVVVNFIIVFATSSSKRAGEAEIIGATQHSYVANDVKISIIDKKTVYSPPSSSSGGGSGGGGGGGGSSGGGGSHGF